MAHCSHFKPKNTCNVFWLTKLILTNFKLLNTIIVNNINYLYLKFRQLKTTNGL